MSPSFYTLPEVAEVLKVSVSTVRRAVKAGELDVTRVGTLGQIRVSQQALDRYIEQSSDGAPLSATASGERPGTLPEPTAHDRPWRTYEHVFIFSKGPRYFFDRRGLKGDEDIWRIVARPENPGAHFAPYPRELVQRCLDVGCKPGGSVLDPFVGSGTTMLAALTRKSPATGIDLKPEYCDFIVERIAREFQARPVNGASRELAAKGFV